MRLKCNAEVYLVRHGETTWNVSRRFQGKLDSALTAAGCAQAEAIGLRLAASVRAFDRILVSPLGRALATSRIIQRFVTCADWRIDSRLAEVSIGRWDGLTRTEIDEHWQRWLVGAGARDWYFRSPDGETYEAAKTRARDWLNGVEGTVIAISHGLLGRIIRGTYLDLSQEEALELPSPHDVIWHLGRRSITTIQI